KSSFMTKSRGPGFLAGMSSVFKDIGSALRKAFTFDFRKTFKGFDLVRILHRGFLGIFKTLRGVLTVLNGIRRFVFSLSGALLIVEALILFGDKIPGINQLLAGAGNALRQLFGDLGKTLSNLNPS